MDSLYMYTFKINGPHRAINLIVIVISLVLGFKLKSRYTLI